MKLVRNSLKYIVKILGENDRICLISFDDSAKTAPVKPKVKPGTRPGTDSPYKPKPGAKPAPKAIKKELPTWLSFDSIGLKID